MTAPSSRTATVVSKGTLSTVCHALEEVAALLGPEAVVIATFQWGTYFRARARVFEALAAGGALVVVAHAGDGPDAPGVHRVRLAPDDPLVDEWTLVVLSPGVAGYVAAHDRRELDLTGGSVEASRRFDATWGWRRDEAAAEARRLAGALGGELPHDAVGRIRRAASGSEHEELLVPELALARAMDVVTARLDARDRRIERLEEELLRVREVAGRDALTGLADRTGLERWLGADEVHDGVPMPPVGVLVIDLDGFKAVNDEHGHETGDRVLAAVAAALRSELRPGDLAVRWGGDEFVVVCPGLTERSLADVGRRLVEAVASVDVDGAGVRASVGAGLTTHRPLPLGEVDAAMYRAKRAGGGRVVSTGDGDATGPLPLSDG
jgi:diguanylate cyclase (GGDEF)-like protein